MIMAAHPMLAECMDRLGIIDSAASSPDAGVAGSLDANHLAAPFG
jgi:hypothetical protein